MTVSTPVTAPPHFVRSRMGVPPLLAGRPVLQGKPLPPLFALSQRRTSAEKIEVQALRRAIADPAFVARILDEAFPAPSQHQQCLMASAFLGIHPETVRRWIIGVTSPKFSDFWPAILRAYGRRDPRAARMLAEFLREAG